VNHKELQDTGRKALITGLLLAIVGVLLGVVSTMVQNSPMLFGGLLLLALGFLFLGVWSGMKHADKVIYETQHPKKTG
jgi:predicted tellurium resistance membrane protein TerC